MNGKSVLRETSNLFSETAGTAIRYREGVSIRYRERASIRYRVLRIFRKRGGYKVQPNFSAFFPVFFLSKERSLSSHSKPRLLVINNLEEFVKNLR